MREYGDGLGKGGKSGAKTVAKETELAGKDMEKARAKEDGNEKTNLAGRKVAYTSSSTTPTGSVRVAVMTISPDTCCVGSVERKEGRWGRITIHLRVLDDSIGNSSQVAVQVGAPAGGQQGVVQTPVQVQRLPGSQVPGWPGHVVPHAVAGA